MARLQKSARNRILFGVAGGLAEYFHADPAIFRVVFILLTFASGIGVLLYLILALLMARPESATTRPLEVVKDNLRTAPRETTEAGRRFLQLLRGPAPEGGAAERPEEPMGERDATR
ncbi:MAG: PspC domain-containing protein [Armatimonadota bacterium]|nr:PspC domain-containing protein [Armatimonadota bacterium]MDR7452245.1 PspC domain-containing protein [Armatimonadota bacterium]MDR7466660.1 PspC domain-containing protein [Armatimonadota bacterium]MDR7492866.1 PspC domain-containing protein [Armatimonadota bacterium]MDR7498642.1 PspC domain-containing protein [Armatimonadota bacterium]